LLVDFLLGALAQRDAALAAGLAVGPAILLAGRERLHRLVRDTLSERELHDALLFAACALIVLPPVPDRAFGPNHAFNPATVWRRVVIVMAMQGAGYVALRAIGPRYGLLVIGLLGGFVSSTATIALMGRRAAREPPPWRGATAAGVVSSVATVVLLAVVIGGVPVLREVALALILAGLAAVGYAVVFAWRAVRDPAPERWEGGRAFDLRVAVLLAVTVAVLLVASGALNATAGRAGLDRRDRSGRSSPIRSRRRSRRPRSYMPVTPARARPRSRSSRRSPPTPRARRSWPPPPARRSYALRSDQGWR
jgi:uncharacterized membrane protein (DUF4010 family)